MKPSPMERPLIRVELTLPDGEVLERDWKMTDVPKPDLDALRPWVDNPRKAWDHPQDPITFKGDVKPEHVDDVRRFLS